MRRLRYTILGCPVCSRPAERLHLSFCRWRAEPIDLAVPPIMLVFLAVVPFWATVGFLLRGWIGLGCVLMAFGIVELVLAAVAPRARRAQPLEPVPPDEVVGELYPQPDVLESVRRLFEDPAFLAELHQAEIDLAAGRGTPFRELRSG